jgi:ferredoxin
MEVRLYMAYVIDDACINCGACESECPTSAISAGEDKYVINPDECIDCGACADVCPVDAPKPE